MIYKLCIPAMEDIPEVRVLDWHRQPGDAIETGDLIVELETHKVIIEIRAAHPGHLRQTLAAPGDWLPPRRLLALVSDTPAERLPPEPHLAGELLVVFEIT